jgi:hypothetical protein
VSTEDATAAALAAPAHAVRVHVTFHAADEPHAQAVVAKLIDSAHEIANLPECECDVDVSVETSPLERSPASADAGGAPPRGRPPKS